ncbi:MAG: bile acid:sodium symporter family protein [Bacteroidia bacterium]|nr:bile acid:sodium symporter family protein [Bacteroidia bacterium]
MKQICKLIAQWMGALILLTAIFALIIPAPLGQISTKAINPLLGVIMFGMGLTLTTADLGIIRKRPEEILVGCLAQFTIMPTIAWILVKVFSLPDDLAIGVILVGCCPGGTASNVITYLSKGDLALSVGMTAVSTIVAPLLTPFLIWAFAGTITQIDTVGMLLSIIYVVIGPIVCGVLCQKFLPTFTKKALVYLPAFSTVMIMFVVGIIVSHNAEKVLSGGLLVVIVVILHNLGGLFIGYLMGKLLKLPLNKRVAVSIEVGMQNSGLASSLAVIHFAYAPLASIPGAIFSVWHNISGAIMARVYSKKIEKINQDAAQHN